MKTKKEEEILKLSEKISEKLKKEKSGFFKKISVEKFLKKIKEISFNNKYSLWIIQKYIDDGIQRYEDLDRVGTALNYYHKHKQKLDIKDRNIMNIKSLVDLENLVEPFAKIDKQKELEKLQKEKIYSETEFLYEGPEGKILIPKTKESSIFWGQGTRWCTASTGSFNHFNTYNKNGPLYIFITNKKDEMGREVKYQFHFESEQFMDLHDKRIFLCNIRNKSAKKNAIDRITDELDFFSASKSKNEYWKEEIFSENIIKHILHKNGFFISLISEPSEEMYLHALKMSHSLNEGHKIIKYIKNPSEKVILEMLKISPTYLNKISDPSEEMKIIAIVSTEKYSLRDIQEKIGKQTESIQNAILNNRNLGIKYVENPSNEQKIFAIKKNVYEIENIKNPTDEMKLMVLKKNGLLLRHIDNPTDEMKMIAIKNHGGAIDSIKNPTDEMVVEAIKSYPYVVSCFINGQKTNIFNEKLLMTAIEQKKDIVKDIFKMLKDSKERNSEKRYSYELKKYSYEFKKQIIELIPESVFYLFENPTEEIIIFALNLQSNLISKIENPTKNMQLTAISKDKKNIKYIENPDDEVLWLSKSIAEQIYIKLQNKFFDKKQRIQEKNSDFKL